MNVSEAFLMWLQAAECANGIKYCLKQQEMWARGSVCQRSVLSSDKIHPPSETPPTYTKDFKNVIFIFPVELYLFEQ